MQRFSVLQPLAYNLFRVIVGFAYFTHGGSKLFGWFGGNQVSGFSEFMLAGIIETACGLLVMVGLQASWAAFIASGEMAVAYFWKHAARDGFELFHWQNRGELVMVFSFAFLLIATMGSGTASVDAVLRRRSSSG